MEKIKKTILQAVITETTTFGKTKIIPDLDAIYQIKIALKQTANDLGTFDAYIEDEE